MRHCVIPVYIGPRYNMRAKLFVIFTAMLLLMMSMDSYAESSGIDWNEYDSYYNYSEKSAGLAMFSSILPVWSGSFHAGFNAKGLVYVLLKSGSAACAVYNRNIFGEYPIIYFKRNVWLVAWAVFTFGDMGHASDSVNEMNNRFSIAAAPRYNDSAFIEPDRKKIYGLDGVNIYASISF